MRCSVDGKRTEGSSPFVDTDIYYRVLNTDVFLTFFSPSLVGVRGGGGGREPVEPKKMKNHFVNE